MSSSFNLWVLRFFFFFFFLGPHLWHVEIPGQGVKLKLQLPAYATVTATATQDPSHICDLYSSSWQHWMLNPLSEARNQTFFFMDTSQARYHWVIMETSQVLRLTYIYVYICIHTHTHMYMHIYNFTILLFLFLRLPLWHMEVLEPGIESKPQLQPTPQLQQHQNF